MEKDSKKLIEEIHEAIYGTNKKGIFTRLNLLEDRMKLIFIILIPVVICMIKAVFFS